MKKLHRIAKAIYLHKIMIACGAVAVIAVTAAAISFKHSNVGECNIFLNLVVCHCSSQ